MYNKNNLKTIYVYIMWCVIELHTSPDLAHLVEHLTVIGFTLVIKG